MTRPTGKAIGGHARAAAMTPGQRSEVARRAAEARWNGPRKLKPATKGEPVKDSAPHRFHPDTLPAVVTYLKERFTAIETRLKLEERDRAEGEPDPNPTHTQNMRIECETLHSVLRAIRDAELKHAKREIEEQLGI